MKALRSPESPEAVSLVGATFGPFRANLRGLLLASIAALGPGCSKPAPDITIGDGAQATQPPSSDLASGSGGQASTGGAGANESQAGLSSGGVAGRNASSASGGALLGGAAANAAVGGGQAAGASSAAGTLSVGGAGSTAGASSRGGGSSVESSGRGGDGAGGGAMSPSTSNANEACGPLKFSENVTIAGTATDRFEWFDADCRPRSAAMARVGGGYVRQFSYVYDGKTRTATGTGVNGQNGWGYPVSRDLADAIAQDGEGTFEPVFVGKHHALYQYRVKWPGAEDVVVVLSWFFATGRSNPVVAITYDLSAVEDGDYEADARTPDGDIAWDGDENAGNTEISGVGWGDRYQFVSTKAPLTMDSSWDYTKPNLVPYVFEWTEASDAEMGAVQTQTDEQHDAGGYWFYENWGKTSANQIRSDGQAGAMPVTWNWSYQMNQYELCGDDATCDITATTGSHRVAWGSNYGAVGNSEYPAYGDDATLVGYPYQSYSVSMVLGKHSDRPVLVQVAEIEAVQKTKLTASVGVIATQGLAGISRPDKVALSPVGYDAVHSLWLAQAKNDALTFEVVAPGSLENPVLRLENYRSKNEPQVSLNGAALVEGSDYFVSLDSANQAAYITFHVGWSGTESFEIHP